MKYAYQAKERDGAFTAGEIETATLAEARGRLRSRGLFVTALTPAHSEAIVRATSGFAFFRRVKKADVVMMLSQLTIMGHAEVALTEALQSIAAQCPKPAFREIIERLHDDVSGGSTFADALRKHPHVFDDALVAGVAAGEQSGAIAQVLERLTYLMRGDMRLKAAVWGMLSYPLVLCGVTVVVLNALIFFVLPQFAKVFAELDQPAPPLTRFLLGIGDLVRNNLLLLGAVVLGSAGAAYAFRNADFLRRWWDYATLNLAVVKTATRALCTGRSFRLLGVMLLSGVPLVEAIGLCRTASRNRLFRELFDGVEINVLHGEGLGRTLLASPILPAGAAQMVATAERSGKLGEVLKMIGEYFEDEGERRLREVVKLLEPTVIVLLGVLVAGVALSVILPLLDVSSLSQ